MRFCARVEGAHEVNSGVRLAGMRDGAPAILMSGVPSQTRIFWPVKVRNGRLE
jgi:hypothetical protein